MTANLICMSHTPYQGGIPLLQWPQVLVKRRLLIGCLVILLNLGCSWPTSASEGFEELVQVIKSGATEKTLMKYVHSSPVAYVLTVDEILYLSDLGVSTEMITAINAHSQSMNGATPIAGATMTNALAMLEDDVGAESDFSETEAVAESPEKESLAQDVVQETVTVPPVIMAPPLDAMDYSFFYDGLAPYGSWLFIDSEWCWQPTAVRVDPGWTPYCQRGRWVYSDCGWVWQSSYSWGWAPFHYGRWRHHTRHGWIWYPGRVWGPAWVCWRYSNMTIGWAPLPPEVTYETSAGLFYHGRAAAVNFDFGLSWGVYTFVPVGRFCEPSVARYRFPRPQVAPIFHATTVIQNQIVYQQGRICNVGPPPANITIITHQEIRPVIIIDHTIRAGAPIPRPRISGSTLAFYRPPIVATVRENPRQVVIRRETRERELREAIQHDDVFHDDRNPSTVQGEQTRGRESRRLPHPFTAPTAPSAPQPPDIRQRELLRLTEEAARHRQAEETAARMQEVQRRRVEELIQVQNVQRQQDQEQARQRALAEQQHREGEFARQQEAQRRAQVVARQQESQRRIQEVARQQDRQRTVEAATQAIEQQRQTLRVQRQAEEIVARQQVEQVQSRRDAAVAAVAQQRETHKAPLPATLPGYGDPAVTKAASNRGADSRDAAIQYYETLHPHGR